MSASLLVLVIFVALAFTYINGFHDTANSIATVVATKVLTPGQAVVMAAVTNLAGALMGTAVAETIATGLVNTGLLNQGGYFLLSALAGACIWNLGTWWLGLPSSSSHALIGGMVGAALAASGNNLDAVIWWSQASQWWQAGGVVPKVIIPMVLSPILGMAVAFALMLGLYLLLLWCSRRRGFLERFGRTPFVNSFFGKSQIGSAAVMGLSHGMNDAQKTMGIVALALAGATMAGTLDGLPQWLDFLRIQKSPDGQFSVPVWVVVLCALTMAAGTAGGGWRIIKTLGHKMVRLHPINGFVAETSSAMVILAASSVGIPVSTTHCVSSSIMGVGAAKRFSAIRWTVVKQMVWAWVMTLPVTAVISYCITDLLTAWL